MIRGGLGGGGLSSGKGGGSSGTIGLSPALALFFKPLTFLFFQLTEVGLRFGHLGVKLFLALTHDRHDILSLCLLLAEFCAGLGEFQSGDL